MCHQISLWPKLKFGLLKIIDLLLHCNMQNKMFACSSTRAPQNLFNYCAQVNEPIYCLLSRTMSGETFNWKMWVIQMCLDDCRKDFFVHRLITVGQGSYCSSSHVCCVLCREWLCWWWARQRPSPRSQLSGPCLWRTWLRSSSPQRWVSQKITSAGKSDMAITVFCLDLTN